MADPITITIPHKLSRLEARARVEDRVGNFKQQLMSAGMGQVTHQWHGDSLNLNARALGQAMNGRIHVNEHDLKIEIELPGLLGTFADKIAGRLKREGALLLEKK